MIITKIVGIEIHGLMLALFSPPQKKKKIAAEAAANEGTLISTPSAL